MDFQSLMTSYCGAAPVPAEIASRWNFDPWLIGMLVLAALVATRSARPVGCLAGIGVVALIFVSPLCALSVSLFSARAVHHLLLIGIAAPLLALAIPARRPAGAALPFVAATGALWVWHWPALYDAALGNIALYWLMQLTLLGSAIRFWRAALSQPPVPSMFWLAAVIAQMGLLGALLTFSRAPLYAAHAATTEPWGLSALADQQLAGLIMWVPGIAPYALAALAVARRSWKRGFAPA